MPQRRTPQSLRIICELEITRNLRIYSTDELQNLPTQLSEELIDLHNEELRRKKKDCLRFKNRNRLIKPNMKKLDLLFPLECHEEFFHETLMIVLEACKNLTHFSCDFTIQPHVFLHQLVTSIPNIIDLKLNIGDPEEESKDLENIDEPGEESKDLEYNVDDILEAIGNNCFKLEILHLTNLRITDDGVRRFCQSNSAGAKIKELNLNENNITFSGCLTALRNLKQLRRFNCRNQQLSQFKDHVVEAFIKLFEDSKESPIPTFQLCEIWEDLDIDRIPTGFLSFMTACCPNVRNLNLTVHDNFERHIKDIKSCNDNICLNLDIWYVDNMANLGYVGYRVTKLSLMECNVHLPTIGFSCPNLTDLTLSGVEEYMPFHYVARNNSVVPYSKLLKLHLSSDVNWPIPMGQLQFLLENCVDLQVFKIEYNDELTDDEMFRILHGVNPLRYLTHFELRCCYSSVTVAPIFDLLAMENNLATLVIHRCRNIRKVARLQIDSFIKENNFCVTLNESDDN